MDPRKKIKQMLQGYDFTSEQINLICAREDRETIYTLTLHFAKYFKPEEITQLLLAKNPENIRLMHGNYLFLLKNTSIKLLLDDFTVAKMIFYPNEPINLQNLVAKLFNLTRNGFKQQHVVELTIRYGSALLFDNLLANFNLFKKNQKNLALKPLSAEDIFKLLTGTPVEREELLAIFDTLAQALSTSASTTPILPIFSASFSTTPQSATIVNLELEDEEACYQTEEASPNISEEFDPLTFNLSTDTSSGSFFALVKKDFEIFCSELPSPTLLDTDLENPHKHRKIG